MYRLKRIGFLRKQARLRRDSHRFSLAEYRAVHLMLALRRHKNRTGLWPVDLAELAGDVDAEAFVDPMTGKGFVYRRDGTTFVLYSLWPDGTDDGGKPGSDRMFWPR